MRREKLNVMLDHVVRTLEAYDVAREHLGSLKLGLQMIQTELEHLLYEPDERDERDALEVPDSPFDRWGPISGFTIARVPMAKRLLDMRYCVRQIQAVGLAVDTLDPPMHITNSMRIVREWLENQYLVEEGATDPDHDSSCGA